MPQFKNEITKAYIVGDDDHTPVKIEENEGKRTMRVPRNGPNAIAYTVCLEISGDKVER